MMSAADGMEESVEILGFSGSQLENGITYNHPVSQDNILTLDARVRTRQPHFSTTFIISTSWFFKFSKVSLIL